MIVKCVQTGKNLTVKPTDLSPEDDEPLSRKPFISGCGLMLDECGKQYPVQFICFAGMSILYYRNATQSMKWCTHSGGQCFITLWHINCCR